MTHAKSTTFCLGPRWLRGGLSPILSGMAWLIVASTSSFLLAGPDDEKPDRSGRLSINASDGAAAARVVTAGDGAPEDAPAAATGPEGDGQPYHPNGWESRRHASAATQSSKESLQIAADPAIMKGIQPGRTSREELSASWGAPTEITKVSGRVRHIYHVEPFSKVVITFEGDVVQAIVIYLEKPIAPERLAKQLKLTGIVPVSVPDERGQPLGEAYPERGVLFAYAPNLNTPHVQQVVLEEIDQQPFLLRAETRWRDFPAHSLADADFALILDPQSARAHWLRAQSLASLGKFIEALRAAHQACEIEPAKAEFQLTLASVMVDLGDFSQATKHLEEVIASKKAPPIIVARANCLRGNCLTGSVHRNHVLAMQYHQKAIQQAEALSSDRNAIVRRAAKEILVDAHLGVARVIALGRWQQKNKAVPKWLARAKGFADDLVAHEQAGEGVVQRVHESAITTLSAIPREVDSRQWIDATQKLGRKLILKAEPQTRAILEWRLALALSDSVAIEQAQGRPTEAMHLGEYAVKLLESCGAAGEETPGHDFLAGRLYYRLGAIAAIEQQDHKTALKWYDQAVPLLESPVPSMDFADPARQGDMFVSMAVSYWEVGGRELALRLTKEGVGLIEQAVEEGLAARKVLAVPYGNLATMFTDLGDETQARQYLELAARSERTKQK